MPEKVEIDRLNRSFYRLILGEGSKHAQECFDGGWIGADWFAKRNLENEFPEERHEFNKKFVPIYLNENSNKTKIGAGLDCGMLFTICKKIKIDEIVLCSDGHSSYRIGKIVSDYYFAEGENLPHRRKVEWLNKTIHRSEMSVPLRNSSRSVGRVSDITKHSSELEKLIFVKDVSIVTYGDMTIEEPSIFAMEKHLEDFLVKNWSHTDFGKAYDIVMEEGEIVGQQFPTDTGPIDILAVSKDKKELLVVELKKGRASDAVVGQIQRYMGYIQDEVAEVDQSVKGVIVAFQDDLKIRRALKINPTIDFYRYEVNFKLFAVQ